MTTRVRKPVKTVSWSQFLIEKVKKLDEKLDQSQFSKKWVKNSGSKKS